MKYRYANQNDLQLLFEWTNDPETRKNSYNKCIIEFEDHIKWFNSKMAYGGCQFYIFSDDENRLIGQIRIEMMLTSSIENALISISVDQKARGRKYASQMISLASSDYKRLYPVTSILAYVFKENIASFKSFINAGYTMLREEIVKDIPSYILVKN